MRGYNGYDLFTESNLVSLPSMDYKTEEEIAAELAEQERIAAAAKAAAEEEAKQNAVSAENQANRHDEAPEKEKQEPTISYFLTVCLVCALLVVSLALAMALILRSGKRQKRRRKKKRRRRRR